jgi:hypothetical protein
MFGKTEEKTVQPVKTKKKLSRADKKQIEAAIARANRTDKTQNEDKTAIFEGWCDFLNYFDSSIHFQLSFLNLAASEETFANSISIPHKGYSSVFPFLKMGADCCLADTIFMKCHCCFIIDSVHDYMGMTFSEHCFRLLFLSVFPVMHFFQKK